jgi:hypothetical protein
VSLRSSCRLQRRASLSICSSLRRCSCDPVVHVLFLKDDVTGSLGAVTFQTSDRSTALKFDAYDSEPINVIIKIGEGRSRF